MNDCDDCYAGNCPTCGTHYCCDDCECAMGHHCPCGCREFEHRAAID